MKYESQLYSCVGRRCQRTPDKARDGATHLVEPCSRDDERDALQRLAALPVAHLVHGQREDPGLVVQALHEVRVVRRRREHLHVQVQVRLLRRHPPVVLRHRRLAVRHVDPRVHAPRPVLRVRADDLQPVAVDAPRQRVPERVLDHPRQAVHRVLRQPRLVQHDPLAPVVARQRQLLQQVRQHVRALPDSMSAAPRRCAMGCVRACARVHTRISNVLKPLLVAVPSDISFGPASVTLIWKSPSVSSCSRITRIVSSTSIRNRRGPVLFSSCDIRRCLRTQSLSNAARFGLYPWAKDCADGLASVQRYRWQCPVGN